MYITTPNQLGTYVWQGTAPGGVTDRRSSAANVSECRFQFSLHKTSISYREHTGNACFDFEVTLQTRRFWFRARENNHLPQPIVECRPPRSPRDADEANVESCDWLMSLTSPEVPTVNIELGTDASDGVPRTQRLSNSRAGSTVQWLQSDCWVDKLEKFPFKKRQ